MTLAHTPLALTDDFNGDGKSDILWRNTDGTLVEREEEVVLRPDRHPRSPARQASMPKEPITLYG